MASEATAYREDVEQVRRRFAEFRETNTVAFAGAVVGCGGKAGAAGWSHDYGAGAGRGPSQPL
jgi:hypothetical protein